MTILLCSLRRKEKPTGFLPELSLGIGFRLVSEGKESLSLILRKKRETLFDPAATSGGIRLLSILLRRSFSSIKETPVFLPCVVALDIETY